MRLFKRKEQKNSTTEAKPINEHEREIKSANARIEELAKRKVHLREDFAEVEQQTLYTKMQKLNPDQQLKIWKQVYNIGKQLMEVCTEEEKQHYSFYIARSAEALGHLEEAATLFMQGNNDGRAWEPAIESGNPELMEQCYQKLKKRKFANSNPKGAMELALKKGYRDYAKNIYMNFVVSRDSLEQLELALMVGDEIKAREAKQDITSRIGTRAQECETRAKFYQERAQRFREQAVAIPSATSVEDVVNAVYFAKKGEKSKLEPKYYVYDVRNILYLQRGDSD